MDGGIEDTPGKGKTMEVWETEADRQSWPITITLPSGKSRIGRRRKSCEINLHNFSRDSTGD